MTSFRVRTWVFTRSATASLVSFGDAALMKAPKSSVYCRRFSIASSAFAWFFSPTAFV
jgi:hypothetical protein